MPVWSGTLCNLYWRLRYCRQWNQACRRRYYRKMAVEKKRLEQEGVDRELVRLFCRHLSNPRNLFAEKRYKDFEALLKRL
jgi:hypothetical protein